MTKLKKLLDAWYEGHKVRGIDTPPPETIDELYYIYKKEQRTTINRTVVDILIKCNIAVRESGIGWEILG